jgi:hypothetical protein
MSTHISYLPLIRSLSVHTQDLCQNDSQTLADQGELKTQVVGHNASTKLTVLQPEL